VSKIELLSTESLSAPRAQELRAWLIRAFDGDFSDEDWHHALGGVHALIEDGRGIVSHAAVVPRSISCDGRLLHAGYVEAVATRADRRMQGHASHVLEKLGEILARDYDIGVLSTALPEVYVALGWQCWRGPCFVQLPHARTRTPDDDGGIMVLRTPRTPPIDVAGDITADWRSGDVW
jgi:aminoglycoside 2'-N-acetyltransferase I